MSDWVLVETANLPPAGCITCRAIKAPLIDTRVDLPLLPNGGRVYLCKNCGRQVARIFGFAPGEKLDELHEASDLLEAARKESAAHEARARTMETELQVRGVAYGNLEAELDQANGRADQLQATIDRMVADAQAQLAAVGIGADPIREERHAEADPEDATALVPSPDGPMAPVDYGPPEPEDAA